MSLLTKLSPPCDYDISVSQGRQDVDTVLATRNSTLHARLITEDANFDVRKMRRNEIAQSLFKHDYKNLLDLLPAFRHMIGVPTESERRKLMKDVDDSLDIVSGQYEEKFAPRIKEAQLVAASTRKQDDSVGVEDPDMDALIRSAIDEENLKLLSRITGAELRHLYPPITPSSSLLTLDMHDYFDDACTKFECTKDILHLRTAVGLAAVAKNVI